MGLRLILKMKQVEIKDVVKFDKVALKSLLAPQTRCTCLGVLNIIWRCVTLCGEDTGIVVEPLRYATSNPPASSPLLLHAPPAPRAPPPPLQRDASLSGVHHGQPASHDPAQSSPGPDEIFIFNPPFFWGRRSVDRRRASTSPCQVETEGRLGS